MEEKNSHIYAIAWLVAILVSGSALVYKYYFSGHRVDIQKAPVVGLLGSTHAHASMLVFVGGEQVSFCDPKYMLASQIAHFEDDDCTVVHVHATGVTLQTFFRSIEVKITPTCFETDRGKYCNDERNTLRAVINGVEVPLSELEYYDLNNNDHILLNYGPESDALLRFKYNQVPNIPEEVNEPEADATPL